MTTLFLIFALIFPRLTLLINWMCDSIPLNDTPFWADFLCTLFFPRFLVAYWAYDLNQAVPNSVHIIWIGLFILFGLLEFLGGGSKANSRRE